MSADTGSEPVGALARPPLWRQPRWLALGAVVVVAVAVLVTLLLLDSGGSSAGERSAQAASQRFVTAIDAGDKDAAAAVSCPQFADQARGAAETGADPGIGFTLDAVSLDSVSTATAHIVEQIHFSGSNQRVALTLGLERHSGRWLVCVQH